MTWTHLESSFVVEDGHHGVCKSRAAGNSPSPPSLGKEGGGREEGGLRFAVSPSLQDTSIQVHGRETLLEDITTKEKNHFKHILAPLQKPIVTNYQYLVVLDSLLSSDRA